MGLLMLAALTDLNERYLEPVSLSKAAIILLCHHQFLEKSSTTLSNVNE